MQNIGLLFIKMGQYNDACTSFEFVMQEKPDFKTGITYFLYSFPWITSFIMVPS